MDFSVNFQLRLLLLFYLDKEFYVVSRNLVKAEVFNSVFCQWLFKYLEIYVELYKSLPTKLVVEEELRSNRDFIELQEEQVLIDEFLKLLQAYNLSELQYVKDTFLKFAKAKAIKFVLNEQSEAVDGGDFDELFTSLKLESRKFELVNKYRDKELFSLRNLRELYDNKEGIKSGLSLIDNSVGGLLQKEMSIVLADTNVGKSLFLVHIGGFAVKQYKKVLHVTLEMSFARTLSRYLTNLGDDEDDVSYVQIANFDPPDKILSYVHDKLRERYEGLLQIEDFPAGKCTVQNLENLLDKYPDTELLIVDYLQLLKPIKRRDQLRFELSDLATSLKGIADERKIHVASAAQATRMASNRRIIGKEFTAEDYSIMRIPEIGIGMGQNKDDAIKKEVILYLARSRNSEKFLAERYMTDFRRMRLKLLKTESIFGDGGH